MFGYHMEMAYMSLWMKHIYIQGLLKKEGLKS